MRVSLQPNTVESLEFERFFTSLKNRFERMSLCLLKLSKIRDSEKLKIVNYSFDLKCINGHEFTASGNTLRKGACFCRKCGDKPQVKLKENFTSNKAAIEYRFKNHGFTLLDTEQDVETTEFKRNNYTMICDKGHTFTRSGNSLRKGHWNCPSCSKNFIGEGGSIEEEYVRLLLQNHFNEKFENVRPDWLINEETGFSLELDLYCSKLNLAFEYNGPTHYKAIFGEEKLLLTQKKDKQKKLLCVQNNVRFYTIKYENCYSTIGFLRKIALQLLNLGIVITEENIMQTSQISLHQKD